MARTKEDLGAVVMHSIRDLVDASESDLRAFCEEIAKEAILAAASGDDVSLTSLKAQVGPLCGHHKINPNPLALKIIERVMGSTVRQMVAAV